MNTQISKNKGGKLALKDFLESEEVKKKIAASLPRHVTADRWMRTLMTALQKTPKLMECSQGSLFLAMMNLSQTGLEADGHHAHLIPFANRKEGRIDCQLIIDYKGLIRMIRQSEEIEDIYAEVVYANDHFEIEMGTDKRIVHKPEIYGDRGEFIGAYSVAVITGSPTRSFDWMSKTDVEKIRARSRSANSGPWVTDYAEMAKKTVVRRHAKYLPMTIEVAESVRKDDEPLQKPASRDVTPSRTGEAPDFLSMPDAGEAESDDDDLDYSEPDEASAKKAAQSATEKLLAQAEADGVSEEQLRAYATTNNMDIDQEKDAKRILNGWKSVKGMVQG